MKKIVFSSHNKGKIAEIKSLLEPLGFCVLDANEAGIPDVEETGKTFEENALLKARAGHATTGLPVMADDFGFCVTALAGEPGVYSARYAASCGGYSQAFDDLMKKTKGKSNAAYFMCVIAFVDENGDEKTFEGRVDGTLVPPQGQDGFGFDPVFMPTGHTKTFAQMNKADKNNISHRGRALGKCVDYLKTIKSFNKS